MQFFSLFPNLLQTHAVRRGAATGCLHSALWATVCISAVLSSQPPNHLLSASPSLASPAFDAGVNRSCVWFSCLCYHCFVLCLGWVEEKMASRHGFSDLRVCAHHLEVVSGSHFDSLGLAGVDLRVTFLWALLKLGNFEPLILRRPQSHLQSTPRN